MLHLWGVGLDGFILTFNLLMEKKIEGKFILVATQIKKTLIKD